MIKRVLLLGLAFLVTACKPAPVSPTPTPGLLSLRLVYSPDSRPALTAIEQCADSQPELTLLSDELPTTVMESSGAEVWIRLGIPENWGGFAAWLADERIALIVNPENKTPSLNLEEIRSIFSGQIPSWDQIGGLPLPIQVWVPPPFDEARQILDQNLLASQPISDQAYLATSPQQMLQAIADDPRAIGYLPQAWVDSTVRLLPMPPELRSRLAAPLLALSNSEPEGQSRDFLACLQNGTGQQTLDGRYKP